jgi:hypothetical protein
MVPVFGDDAFQPHGVVHRLRRRSPESDASSQDSHGAGLAVDCQPVAVPFHLEGPLRSDGWLAHKLRQAGLDGGGHRVGEDLALATIAPALDHLAAAGFDR